MASVEGAPFTLRGAGALSGSPEPPALRFELVRIDRAATFVPPSRGEAASRTTEVRPDDLIEIEFAGGERLWMRADEYRARFGGLAPARDAGGREALDVPPVLQFVPAPLRTRDTRGVAGWVVKSLKVLGVDLAGRTAKQIAAHVEEKTQPDGRRPGLGLFRCRLQTGGFALETPESPSSDGKPWLLFVHGTGSSTWGSFGELWSTSRSSQLLALRAKYGDRVLAFEHRSLTESPIRNALDLLRELDRILPGGAPLHLVTHSRGGLVGELLCRSTVVPESAGGSQPPPFEEDEIGLFSLAPGQRRDPDLRFDPEDFKLLGTLREALRRPQFPVERFVRVACPALGTTLASGRLDRWLSVIGTLASLLPSNPVADVFADLGDFVAAVVKERTDPRALPGLQAMMPDAHCIKLANWPEKTVAGHLAVIAGDIDPAKWWARLAIWLTDRFYEGDHDLVVNTPSMYGGVRRTGRAVVSFHKADAVNHFTYFREQSSAERLVEALTAPDDKDWPGFEPLHPPAVPIARAAPRSAKPQPTVFVLPGVMGSELSAGDRSIWINPLQLLRGGLVDLAVDAPGIRASTPLERYYGRICEHLSSTHNVVPFAYDWRLGIETEADKLAAAVRAALDAAKGAQPIRFLAHSMGGLIVRAMIARHEALWREIAARPDARFVMLGTPNGGSYAIPELIVGQSVVLRKLARLDVRHRAEELLRTIVRFPGLLAMLPAFPDDGFFSTETWSAFHARSGGGWVQPDAAGLASAQAARRLVDGSPLAPDRMVYVAGSSDVTVAGMRLELAPGGTTERIVFTGTARGDGRVTWDTGIPPSLPVYYMDVQHGDLASYEPAFPALEDLLQRGETTLLPRTAPVARATSVTFDMPPAEDDRYPDRDDMTAAALGAGTRARSVPKTRAERPVKVSVVHGNLAFTRYPVAVGHYSGDTIVSAEKHLDRALDGALSHRLHLGLYPGPLETNAIFTNPRLAQDPYARPGGAIVVGLGAVGALTASSLTRSFARALLEYVLERRKSSMPGSEEDGQGIGISTLLIGTGAGGMSVTDSVFALVRGARLANESLGAAERAERIAEVEIIELYEDRAMLALEALDRLVKRPGGDAGFTLVTGLGTRDGGLQRVSYDDEAPDWWHRLQVSGVPDGAGGRSGGLRFAAVTRRARTEVTLLSTQRAVVDQYVQGTLDTTRHDAGVARTLFDLLLPNELKDSTPDQDNLVLLLDEESAHYPWELLEDSRDQRRVPFVVDHGLLRQLESTEYRAVVRATTELSALVIGDPISPFVELKGAQMEAEAVSRALTPRFSSVTTRVRPRSQDVVTAIFERAFKVVHLAGHGVYRYPVGTAGCTACGQPLPAQPLTPQAPPRTVTGMVIGDGVYLTPAEIAQMRTVPDLVFINCCHLGRVEADRTNATPQEHAFPRLAANLASEFIGMGVRAVVAAGWAVEDDAASTFAVTFYESMLKGETFGEAVKAARQATYRGHPASNTWGAYQCYGDPDFRLVLTREAERREEDPVFLSPAHALRDIGNVAARLKTRSSHAREDEVRRLEAIVRVLDKKNWLSQGALLAALARAFREAGELERAIDYYCKALGADDGAVTARDVEQWANLVGRVAVARWRRDSEDESRRADAVRDLEKSIEVLRDVLGGERGERLTAERLALIGSAYKRLAWVDAPRRKEALDQAADYYRRAADKARERGNELARHLLNMRWADLARRWQEEAAGGGMPAGLVSDLAAVRAQIADDERKNGPQFWQDSMRVDCELLELIFKGLPTRTQLVDVGSQYQARRHHASAREFASVCDQLDFLVAMAASHQELAEGLAELRRRMDAPDAAARR